MSAGQDGSVVKRALAALQKADKEIERLRAERSEPIAIVGAACRFPAGITSPDSFWCALDDGVDGIDLLPQERAELYPKTRFRRSLGGFLEGVDRFDNAFFSITPREAISMDPAQRILLEVTHEALENGGIAPRRLRGERVGVFIGYAPDFGYAMLRSGAGVDAYTATGLSASVASGRLSYLYDWRGPCVALDTACSSSLVAIHHACQSLREGESNVAIAGGVNLLLRMSETDAMGATGALAPDGRCKTFDAAADGYVRSEGAGIVVLKRLRDALASGDRILACVRGSAAAQDGRTNGLTAPNGLAQAQVIRDALRAAGTRPEDVDYVEAHGTGTPLGDPIELEALADVFRDSRPATRPLVLGSVKTNIGHAEVAAGVAGVLKIVEMLRHRAIPRHLHLRELTPRVNWSSLPFSLPRSTMPWLAAEKQRVAGVSSFGFGGTIAHAVLSEAPPEPADRWKDADELASRGEPLLLPLSARSREALREYARSFGEHLRRGPEHGTYRDVAYTASVRRDHHAERLSVVGASYAEWIEKLDAYLAGQRVAGVRDGRAGETRPRVAFVFCGQGPQWWAMARELLDTHPIFRETIESCHDAIARVGGPSLLDELRRDEAESRLRETEIAQPALFALQVALAASWRSWGVEPDAVLGHSVGEIAAAHTANVLGLDAAARLVVLRGRIMQRATGLGKMLSTALTFEEAERLTRDYGGRLSVGASNGPTTTVLSGDAVALEEVSRMLTARGVEAKWLPVAYAFHSAQMDGFGAELAAALGGLVAQPCTVPVVSTVTGKSELGPSFDAAYWGKQIRSAVMFTQGIRELLRTGHDFFVEIGPHPVLASPIRETLDTIGAAAVTVPTLRRNAADRATFLDAVAALHCAGYPVDFERQYAVRGRALPLPTYPWQRRRCWVDVAALDRGHAGRRLVDTASGARLAHPLLERHVEIAGGDGAHVWETEVTTSTFPYLQDHRIQDAIVFPGAAYAEMALAAGKELLGEALRGVADLALLRPLVLRDDEATAVQLQLTRGAAKGPSFRICGRSSTNGDAPWVTLAEGTLRRAAEVDDREERHDPSSIVERCADVRSASELYETAARRGVLFGPRFRNLERIWRRDGEAIARLVPAPEVARRAGEYVIHPALLDAAFQCVVPAIPKLDDGGAAVVVARLGSLCVVGDVSRAAWVHAVARETPAGAKPGTLEGDSFVLDEEGRVLAEVRDLRLERLERAAVGQDELIARSLYDLTWRRSDLPASASHSPSRGVVLAGDAGAAERLRSALEQRTVRSVRIPVDLASKSPDELVAILDAPDVASVLADGDVVYLAGPRAEQDALPAFHASLRDVVAGALHLVQALARCSVRPRLWIVTRGAQRIATDEKPCLAQAPLWGFAATVARELPDLRCTLVDVDRDATQIGSLVDELSENADEERVALRGDGRWIQRVARHVDSSPAGRRKELVVGDDGYRLELARPGSVDSLDLVETPRRSPGRDEVEIRVAATGLNFRDVLMALGMYPSTGGARLPIGSECSGVVTAVGEGVRGIRVGDEVIASCAHAFDSHVIAPTRLVHRKPSASTFEDAAAIPSVFSTVYHALHDVARLRSGEKILVHSAAGGVGLAAIQYARHVGAEILATAGTAQKRELLRSMGIATVLDSRSLAWAEEVRAATGGRGVDVVLNSLAGEAIPKGIGVLAPFGRFLELGKRDVYANAPVGLFALRQNVSLSVIALDQLMTERPDEGRALMERVLAMFADNVFTPLPRASFPVSRVTDAFRHMMSGAHVGKIVVTAEPRVSVSEDRATEIRGEASYLVTGGLGGLGLVVARALADRGAKHLALVGRSAPSAEAQERLAALRARGVRVEVFAADVADSNAVSALLSTLRSSMPALRGVVHAAGVLDDATIATLDASKLTGAVVRAKIDAAWHLHAATREDRLDFFVLFSSLAAPLGSPGQANYAAANAFLDALAHHRAAEGLPATAIDWGPWADVGMAARGAAAARLSSLALSPDDGIRLLQHLIATRPTQILALDAKSADALARGKSPLLSELRAAERSPTGATPFRHDLEGKTVEAREDALTAFLCDRVANILRTAPSEIRPAASLSSLGLDSLMSIELRHAVHEQLGIRLLAVDLMGDPTLEALAALLATKVGGKAAGSTAGAGAADVALRGGALEILKAGAAAPRLRLVCFPAAGGEGSDFIRWVDLLPPDVELVAVAYPGSGIRRSETPTVSLGAVAAEAAAALRALPAAPLILFGQSVGALVAHATSVELEQRGIVPLRVALSAPPDVHHVQSTVARDRFSDRDFLLEFMRTLGMSVETVMADTDGARAFLRMFGAHLAWGLDFDVDAKVTSPIHVLYGDADRSIATGLDFWAARAAARHRFEGGHFYLERWSAEVVRVLLEVSAATA